MHECRNLDLIGRIDKSLPDYQDTELKNCSVIAWYLNQLERKSKNFHMNRLQIQNIRCFVGKKTLEKRYIVYDKRNATINTTNNASREGIFGW
jgi:hypothetical protein